MSVYKPSKNCRTWWFFGGQHIRENTKSRSKKIAKEAEKARRRELEEGYNGIKRRPRAKLFSVAADDWLALKKTTLAQSSFRIETDNLRHLRPHFEKLLVIDISAEDVCHYQKLRIAEGASPKTINLEIGTLRHPQETASVGEPPTGCFHARHPRRYWVRFDRRGRGSAALGVFKKSIAPALRCCVAGPEHVYALYGDPASAGGNTSIFCERRWSLASRRQKPEPGELSN